MKFMFIQVHNNHYYVEIKGKGEPIVFLHGFTGSTKTWEPFVTELAKDYQCITIDLPGHGKTIANNIKNMDEAIADLNDVLKQLEVDQAYLVGYSMGGRTALVFADSFPERVKRLILIGASPGLDGDEKKKRLESDDQLATFIVKEGMTAFVNYWENIPLFNSQKQLSDTVQAKIREERFSQSEAGLALSLQSMGTGSQRSMWSSLPTIDIPTLLITGEIDEKFTILNKKMDELLKQSEHIIVPNVGHAVHIEAPKYLLKLIQQFIRSN